MHGRDARDKQPHGRDARDTLPDALGPLLVFLSESVPCLPGEDKRVLRRSWRQNGILDRGRRTQLRPTKRLSQRAGGLCGTGILPVIQHGQDGRATVLR